MLCQPKGQVFRRNTVETFEVPDAGVGFTHPVELQIGHDDTEIGSGWFLERCVVRVKEDEDQGQEITYFPCGQWLGDNDTDPANTGGGPSKVSLCASKEPPQMQLIREATSIGQSVGWRLARAHIPHPAKERGEDAWFTCNGDSFCSAGVSDGVGEWARDGIDSGLFARGLMQGSQHKAVTAESAEDVADLLQEGMAVCEGEEIQGSATAIVATLDRERGALG